MPLYQITPDRTRPAGFQIFSFMGIPVFVQGGFIVFMALILFGHLSGGGSDLIVGGIACLAIFFSLLAHEFGHALTARAAGCESVSIGLVMFGGFATHSPASRARSLLIIAAGPAAGFLLGGIAFAIAVDGRLAEAVGRPEPMNVLLSYMIYFNLFWSPFNLLPIYPLDGGQFLYHLLTGRKRDDRRAMTITAIVSMIVGGVTALVSFYSPFLSGTMIPIFCAMFAFNNFQTYQQLR